MYLSAAHKGLGIGYNPISRVVLGIDPVLQRFTLEMDINLLL